MTEEMKTQARKDFNALLDDLKMSDGKLSYNMAFKYKESSALVWLTLEAYRKIITLVTEFSSEIAWHGSVSRSADNEFIIEDIFVYPQEVTGSTVNTDQKAYTDWLYALDDETFGKLRMQGHSHCNMSVSPSGVDETHRQKILEQLDADMFYIFMIWNKSLSVHTLIYDMSKNILYEDDDVVVNLLGDDGVENFLSDAKEKVKKPGNKKNNLAANIQSVEQLGLHDNDLYDDYFDNDFRYARGLHGRYNFGG
jgi:hypothetical protein